MEHALKVLLLKRLQLFDNVLKISIFARQFLTCSHLLILTHRCLIPLEILYQLVKFGLEVIEFGAILSNRLARLKITNSLLS